MSNFDGSAARLQDRIGPGPVRVFGPAYLDRVLIADRPLVDPATGPPLDGSQEGQLEPGDGLNVRDSDGATLRIEPPDGWPGPWGRVRLARPLVPGAGAWQREVAGLGWHDDLGGMGAGFAAALGGVLISALGDEDDPVSRAVAEHLARAGVDHRPICVPGRPADWTLLLSSGPHGDKLPIGFRGCHDALHGLGPELSRPCSLRVVASLPNRLAAEALRAPGAGVRLFAPAMRNVLDRGVPLSSFAEFIDLMSLNRREWLALADRDAVEARVPLLAITDGPNGSIVRFRAEDGRPAEVQAPAFPRAEPPRDTNRAGETFAATLAATLLNAGWSGGPVAAELVRTASRRASAAAALQLDLTAFGFPEAIAVDAALAAGRVGPG